jgi:hypothetical protein
MLWLPLEFSAFEKNISLRCGSTVGAILPSPIVQLLQPVKRHPELTPWRPEELTPLLRSVDLDGKAAPAERVVQGVHKGDPRRERAPSIARRAKARGACRPPCASRGPVLSHNGEHAQSRPKPRGRSMLTSSSRSRSTIACNAAPVAPSRNASGRASSQAAYAACSATSVVTAACR